jgi:hypothetical protein
MRWIGTDTMALAFILGSAAAGGATTVALLEARSTHGEHHCVVAETMVRPTVVVTDATHEVVVGESHRAPRIISGIRAPSVVVTRHARSTGDPRCAEHVDVDYDAALVEIQELESVEVELGDLESELQELELHLEGLDLNLNGLDLQLDKMGETLNQELQIEIQERIQAELSQARAKVRGRGSF